MKIGLFIPCYVDVVYPQVGVATYKLLKHLGLDVTYPLNQTCCGQPMANAGFEKQAIPLAEKFEDMFKEFDYVVAPSVSCTAFIKINYPRLLKGKHECTTSDKIMDVVEFLHDVVKVNHSLGTFPHKVSLHNSCHGVRELGLSSPSEEHVTPFNKIKDNFIGHTITSLSVCSYGMFFSHVIVVKELSYHNPGSNLLFPVMFVLIVFLSWLLPYVLSKIHYVKRVSGV